jgi:hypothetical protein
MRTVLPALAAALVLAGSAAAAKPRLHVSPLTVARGASVHVYGNADGCPRGDTVSVLSRAFPGQGFAGLGAITARVRRGGAFSAYGKIRRHASPGRYSVTARCGGGNFGVVVYLRVHR